VPVAELRTKGGGNHKEEGDVPRPDLGLPLSQILYDQLRGRILNGALRVGQVLRQEELAQQFNVSRVPLREALSRLEADGLIEARPRRGFAVSALDPHEIVEVFELRAVVEEHAAAVAAQKRTREDVAAAEALLNQMESLDPKSARYHARWAMLNYEFHSRLIASSKRPRLARIVGNLRGAVEPYVRMELAITGDVVEAGREHREILEAFRAGDSRGLAELSRAHVEGTARRLLKGLRERAGRRSRARA
jgi:DNA-binding GntR family transcriptional regulator